MSEDEEIDVIRQENGLVSIIKGLGDNWTTSIRMSPEKAEEISEKLAKAAHSKMKESSRHRKEYSAVVEEEPEAIDETDKLILKQIKPMKEKLEKGTEEIEEAEQTEEVVEKIRKRNLGRPKKKEKAVDGRSCRVSKDPLMRKWMKKCPYKKGTKDYMRYYQKGWYYAKKDEIPPKWNKGE